MNRRIPSFLLDTEHLPVPDSGSEGSLNFAFIDRTIKKSASFIKTSVLHFESSKNTTFFSRISPQVLLIFFIVYVVCIGITHTFRGQMLFATVLFLIVLSSTVNLIILYRRILVLSFLFGFLVMLPASLNLITPGKLVLPIIKMSASKQLFVYHIPATIGITYEGILIVIRMYLKVFNSMTLSFLILNIAPFDRLIKSLRIFRVPGIFMMIITLSYKFIFIMAHTVEEMYLALKSRWIGKFNGAKTRNIIAGRMGLLFKKSWNRYEETYRAMIARGFTGEVVVTGIEKITFKESALLVLLIGIGIAICLI
jgi:cobalt/nickel transport system permease protein